jgi:hypothetical protein
MVRWSPECFAVWVWRRRDGVPTRFVGFNRRGPFVWFTTCRVVTAEPAREFAFDVTTFGLPVSRWGYRMSAAASAPDAGSDGPVVGTTAAADRTEVTEYWLDRRGRGAYVLGRIFTGRVANDRPAANSEGMRTTLARLKGELETGTGAS